MSQEAASPAPAVPAPGITAFFLVSKIFDAFGMLLKSATNVTLAYLFYLSIVEVAGKTTIANIALTYITKEGGKSHVWPWIGTALATAWAYLERHLRLKKIETMGTHNAALEEKIDPQRSSSKLTTTGETGPGDHKL